MGKRKMENEYNNGNSEFVHLHSHTIFSTLDGISTPEDYCKIANENKWPAVTATEHGVFSSIPDMYWNAKKYNLKYFPGCEVYFCDYEVKRQELADKGYKLSRNTANEYPEFYPRMRRNRHLTILCKNEIGYRNLLKINLEANQRFLYGGRARVNFDLLSKYHEGLIILSGCLNGPMSFELHNCNYRTGTVHDEIVGALDYYNKFDKIWGDDFYIEIQMPVIREERFNDLKVFKKLVAIANSKNKKMVLTNDSHYCDRKDFELQKCMMAIDQGLTIDDPNLFHVNSSEQFYKTRPQLRETFFEHGYHEYCSYSDFENACDNTLEIADKCDNFEFNTDPKLPSVDDADGELAKRCFFGFKNLGLDKDKNKYLIDGNEVTLKEQMIIELKRIKEKGFSSYFLITQDIVNKARELHGHSSVGPARGSAGGSLLCYVLGITTLMPAYWGLSFSRFLSPARGGNLLKVTME